MIYVRFKRNTETALVPTKGSRCAAGFDLYADTEEEVKVNPGETVMFQTGLSMEIPDGYFGAIYARSGLASKHGIRPANCVGVVDPDYRGEVGVPVHNDSDTVYSVAPHERIAQMIIQPIPDVILVEREKLRDTDRGSGGFGSTGKR